MASNNPRGSPLNLKNEMENDFGKEINAMGTSLKSQENP